MLRFLCFASCAAFCAAQSDRQPVATPPAPSFAFLTTPLPGMPKMPLPAYEVSEAMFELGRRLFHDGALSRDGSVSCASCHLLASGFAHPDPLPPGIAGQRALRHAPVLFNRGYGTRQRWNGGSATLEQFVLEPIADPREMGSSVDAAVRRLRAQPRYWKAFTAAFGRAPDAEGLRRALATFVRGIVAGDAPYDRFLRGEADAMTKEQRHGQWIFESKGGCWRCHTPPLFTDERFHNTGIGLVAGQPAGGHFEVTGEPGDLGAWKTPTLRGVRLSAPYMHDGSLPDLETVVEFYARGGNPNRHLDRRVRPLDLSPADKRALVAFLRSL
ncbi:MAG TPA: cytochrome-c peroxidase [bacterium]|nr:cytochrome-c peroxidase [bacterium]